MRLRIKRIVFAMLVLSVFIGGDLCAASGANPLEFDGDRLSVHTEGMTLGELLMAVGGMTGVQFTFDELVAAKEVFLNFEGMPLSEGIRQIIHPLSWAAIYDKTGKLRKVIILERWKGSGMDTRRQGRDDSLEGSTPGPSDSIFFTPQRDSNSSGEFKGPPSGKRPVYLNESPVDTAHSGGTLPNTQDEIPEDLPVPNIVDSVHLPIPDSKGAVMEGPPADPASPEGGLPNTRDEIVEDVPVPGVASSEHLPIPGS